MIDNPMVIIRLSVRFMGTNAAFNNISAISWRSVLLVDETGVPGDLAEVTDKLYSIMLYRGVHIS